MCALVRNDRLGRCVRTRGQLQCTTFLPGDADCHRCDHWLAMTPPPCHCEERSDVAIRILCGRAQQKAVLWANSSGVTNLPQQQPACQVSLRGRGLPHQCAHWFAMTCRRRQGICGCKGVWCERYAEGGSARECSPPVIAGSGAVRQAASPAAGRGGERDKSRPMSKRMGAETLATVAAAVVCLKAIAGSAFCPAALSIRAPTFHQEDQRNAAN